MRVPAFKLIQQPIDDAARALAPFKWAPGGVGSRHQLGGDPTYLQAPEWPACTVCREPMSFYGQLDSINDEYVLADCGIIYVFACFDDNEVKALLQSM